jgi:UDP-glucose 4-epimerase
MGRVVAVTGVSGYLGRQLLPNLFENVPDIDQFIGMDIKHITFPSELPVIFYRQDIRDSFSNILIDHSVTDLIHLAWTLTPNHNLSRAYSVDIGGTKSVLDSSLEAEIQYILHVSSTLAYGAHKDNPRTLTEDMPLRGNQSLHYSKHKALAEEIIKEFEIENPNRSFKIGRARPAPILSPGLRNWFAELLQAGWRTMFIQPYPRKNTKIQFLHLNDALQGFHIMLRNRLPGAYNLTPTDDDGGVIMGDIPRLMNNIGFRAPLMALRFFVWVQWKLRISRAPSGFLDFVAFPFVASNEKLRSKGFKPQFSTRETLRSFKET